MSFEINRKSLAVTKALPKGKGRNPRFSFMHVGPQGTTCTDGDIIARISLPKPQSGTAKIFSETQIDSLETKNDLDMLTPLEGGAEAKTTPEYLVPNYEATFPKPEKVLASIYVNATKLRQLLAIACEVVSDDETTVALRICKDDQLRIDGYRVPGNQEFLGAMSSVDYDGEYVPGGKAGAAPAQAEERPKSNPLPMTTQNGRKFRD